LAAGCGGFAGTGGSLPGLVRIWNLSDGKEAHPFPFDQESVFGVAYSPDGKRIAACGSQGQLVVWDAATRAVLARGHPRQSGQAFQVAFSPDGSRVAVAYQDDLVRVWDAQSGKKLLTLTGHMDDVYSVAFSCDGRYLASGARNDHAIRIWDAMTGKQVSSLRAHTGSVPSLVFHPDDWRLASASSDGTVKLWDFRTACERLPVLGDVLGRVRRIAFRPRGERFASAGSADGTLCLWEADTGRLIACLRGHLDWVGDVAFDPTGRWLASAGHDETIRVWDVASGEERHVLRGHDGPVRCVAFRPDGVLFSGGADGTVRTWNPDTGAPIVVSGAAGESEIWTIVFGPDGRWFATVGGTPGVRTEWNPSGAARPGEVIIWDAEQVVPQRRFGRSADRYASLAVSPNGLLLATGGADSVVRLWDVATGAELATMAGHTGIVTDVAFSPDGNRLVSASDTTLRIWDVDTGQELLVLDAGGAALECVRFHPDGRRLVAGGQELSLESLWIWDGRPCTPQSADNREALLWIRHLLSTGPSLDQMQTATRAAAANKEVQQRALALARPMWQSNLAAEAEKLIHGIIGRFPFRDELLEGIRKQPGLRPALREQALAAAAKYVENPRLLIMRSRAVIVRSDASPEAYKRALREAEAASQRRGPAADYLETLAIAQYRTGSYAEAAATLAEAEARYTRHGGSATPAVLAFTALARYRLGDKAAAARVADKLRERLQEPDWISQQEAQRFGQEVEALLHKQPAGP
jgi:WD40 repeat protein